MSDFDWQRQIIQENVLLEIEHAKYDYGNYIKIEDGYLHEVSNWLHGNLEYFKDYEYLIDYNNNHYLFFKDPDILIWFLLSNNLTNYTIHIK